MHLFFSTPVWASKIRDFEKTNTEILSYILELQKKDPEGIIKSNFIGWHSNNFNLNDDIPKKFTNSLSENINEALTDMNWDLESQTVKITSMWAIINKEGAFNQTHIYFKICKKLCR